MNVIPALADHLRQHIPNYYWCTATRQYFDNTIHLIEDRIFHYRVCTWLQDQGCNVIRGN